MQKQDKKNEMDEEEGDTQNVPKYKSAKLKKQWNQIRIYEE